VKKKTKKRRTTIKLLFKAEAKNKLDIYTKLAEGEISGLMRVEKVDSYVVLVKDVILLPQSSSGSETELDQESLMQFIEGEIAANRNVDDLKGWWHSHDEMGVFWSNTDTDTMATLGCEWMVSIVTNKKKEYKARLDIYNPFKLFLDDLEVETEVPGLSQLEQELQLEIDDKVKKQTYLSPTNNSDDAWDRSYNNYNKFWDVSEIYSKHKWEKMVCSNNHCGYLKYVKKSKVVEGQKCPTCHAQVMTWDDYQDYSEMNDDERLA